MSYSGLDCQRCRTIEVGEDTDLNGQIDRTSVTVRLGPGVTSVQIGISKFNVTIDPMERRRVVERAAEREQWAPRMDIQFEKHVEETMREKKLRAS